MVYRTLIRILGIGIVIFITASCDLNGQDSEQSKGTFSLWQLPPQTSRQNMSYVIKTVNGKIMVIDGGDENNATYLKTFLEKHGSHVHCWFISHPHDDHIGALAVLLRLTGSIKIDKIYGSLPDEKWVEKYESRYVSWLRQFQASLKVSGKEITELIQGQVIDLDHIRIEVLAVKNSEITANAINNSSVVFKVSDTSKSILFLGDLGVQGGRKLLQSRYHDKLQADYVQMAHHGQRGVGKEFYETVSPTYCLWPTPLWLWNNDNGGGYNSGKWQTLKVRSWMKKLRVQKNIVAGKGIHRIDYRQPILCEDIGLDDGLE